MEIYGIRKLLDFPINVGIWEVRGLEASCIIQI